MRHRIFALGAVAALAGPSWTADNAVVLRQLDQLNRNLQTASSRKDIPAVMALMTPDFTMKPARGTWVSRTEVERGMKRTWPRIVSYPEWESRIRNLTVKGDTAVGIVDERMQVNIRDAKGVIHQNVVAASSRNTWKRTRAGWRFQKIEELTSRSMESGTTFERRPKGGPSAQARPKAAVRPKALTPAQARAVLEKAYAASRAAFRAGNAAGVMASSTPNYSVEYPTSILNRWQVEKALKEELKATRGVRAWTMDINDVKVAGDTITAIVKEHKVTSIVGPDGKPHTQVVDDRLKDIWIRTPSGWRNRRSVVYTATLTVDGRVRAQ